MVLNNSRDIKVLRYTKKSDFLVFIRAKGISLKITNLIYPEYDLLISIYGDDYKNNKTKGVNIISGGLSKYHAFSRAQNEIPLLLEYDYYIFLDEDLVIDKFQIISLLRFSKAKNLQLAHPILDTKSFSNWKELITDGYSTREYYPTPIVEVMCPILSKNSLNKLLHTFEMSISTWGLDLVWPKILKTKIYVINILQIGHHSVPDTKNGAFYKYLKQIGVNPYLERYRLQFKFKVCSPMETKSDTLKEILESIKQTDNKLMNPVDCLSQNGSSLNLFLNHFSLRKLYNYKHNYGSAEIFVDGFLLFRHLKLRSRRYSFDFTSIANQFFKTIEENKMNALFIGGTIEESRSFYSKIKKNFPNCSILVMDGYNNELIKQIENKIESTKTDIVVLGLGSPLQENIGFMLYEKYKNSNLKIFTCGGFISQVGRTNDLNYYPKFFKRRGRFLYRIFEQRGVLKRILVDYPMCILLIERFKR